MSPYLAIDFEASCLPRHGRSFPIEVGIADAAGWSRAWLIRPHDDWAGWTWTGEAERLHGLSLHRLRQEGLPAAQVAAELAGAVAGRRVIADSRLDAAWHATLHAAAGSPVPFAIDHVSDIIAGLDTTDADIGAAIDVATRLVPARHRAASDALWLATLVGDLVRRSPARMPAPAFPWRLAASPPGRTHLTLRA